MKYIQLLSQEELEPITSEGLYEHMLCWRLLTLLCLWTY